MRCFARRSAIADDLPPKLHSSCLGYHGHVKSIKGCKVSQGVLRIRRALHVQSRDGYRLRNRRYAAHFSSSTKGHIEHCPVLGSPRRQAAWNRTQLLCRVLTPPSRLTRAFYSSLRLSMVSRLGANGVSDMGLSSPAMLTVGYDISGIEPHSARNVTHYSFLSTANISASRGGCQPSGLSR